MSALSPLSPRTTLVAAPQAIVFAGPDPAVTPQAPLPPQQLNLTTVPRPAIGSTIFPPTGQTAAGATVPPLAAFGGSLLTAVLPTNHAPQVISVLSQTPVMNPGLPTAPGSNQFAATYAPQIYAVFVNGLISTQAVASSALETNIVTSDIARPPISGDPPPVLPGFPPVAPVPAPEGTGQVIAALIPLAGSGAIFGNGSAPAAPQAAPTPAPTPAPAPATAKSAPAPAAKAA